MIPTEDTHGPQAVSRVPLPRYLAHTTSPHHLTLRLAPVAPFPCAGLNTLATKPFDPSLSSSTR